MAKILVTGGAGFIGFHTVTALLERGHHVHVLDSLEAQIHGSKPSFPFNSHRRLTCQKGDIRERKDLEIAIEGIDAVYHFASCTGVGQSMYDMGTYASVNCAGTAFLLEALIKQRKPIKRFVLASSRAVYGEGSHHCEKHGMVFPTARKRDDLDQGYFDARCPHCGDTARPRATSETRPLSPTSVYGWTKKQQEEQCLFAAQTFGLPVTMLRYFNVFGSRQSLSNPYTGIVSIFYGRLMANQPISLYEHGQPIRDFVHVNDVVRANLLALEADVPSGTAINIGSGASHSIQCLAEALASACGKRGRYVDRGEFRVGDIHACYADLERAGGLLGFKPQISLEQGLKEFSTWAHGQESNDRYQQTVDELNRHGLMGRARERAS